MGWTLFALCVVAGLVLESRRRLLAVRALWAVAGPHLERQAASHRRAEVEISGVERSAQVADLNEATQEIGAGLARAGFVPRSCAKASLSFGALVALLQTADLVRADGTPVWVAPAVSFVGGCVGALACLLIGRAAEAEARRLRGDWATLIRRSARDVRT
jgi:hypothetical protein